MSIPWDIYIDERKVKGDRALGFLVVPNSASFMRKLYRCRQINGEHRPHEIHWTKPRRDTVQVCEDWIHCVFQHNGVKFYNVEWSYGLTKEYAILKFLERFCRIKKLMPPYNVVVFLDFDDAHSRSDVQNNIQKTANIARCYHLDSRNNDCIQCCDLLLNASHRLRSDPLVRSSYQGLKLQLAENAKLKNSELKIYLAGFLASLFDTNGSCVYYLPKIPREIVDTTQR